MGDEERVKRRKKKVALIIIFSGILLALSLSFMRFTKLDVYVQQSNGDITSKNGIVYARSGVLSSVDPGIHLFRNKIIGRFQGEGYISTCLIGPRVVKLKKFDEKETILFSGLMLQDVYTRKE